MLHSKHLSERSVAMCDCYLTYSKLGKLFFGFSDVFAAYGQDGIYDCSSVGQAVKAFH